MTTKAGIVEALGETALVLPALVAAGLRANDRAKYYMSLMQACAHHVAQPDQDMVDLRAEREASGEEDATLDRVVAGSLGDSAGGMFVPHADRIQSQLVGSIREMIAPLRVTDPATGETYERRLTGLCSQLPLLQDDTVPAGYVETMTRAERTGPDSLHLLVLDLHRELHRVQVRLAERSLDGARVYGLSPSDEPLVQAFMHGVNATAALKFDHPGLGTTATRAGNQVLIQNDIGTTDAHVLVVHVDGLIVSFIYSDVHQARIRFFKGLLDGLGVEWSGGGAVGGGYETCVGRRRCASVEQVAELLTALGSKLVFLIDWNRARKRLSRFVRKSDAIAALRWAADRGYGHRGFLEAGGERLIYTALERFAPPALRSGARLDEVLGRQAAASLLQAVLRITSEGLLQHRSLRLVRDEVQAELLAHGHQCQEGALGQVADHAALIFSLASALQAALLRMRGGTPADRLASIASRAKRWETKADEIVIDVRQARRGMPGSETITRLLVEADDVADALEEAIFMMTLLPDSGSGLQAADTLEPLVTLTVRTAQEYIKCLEMARDLRRSGTRDDVQQFLIAADRVTMLEHESDEADRLAHAVMIRTADNFRTLHLLAQIARGLEESVDILARCALRLKDHVMSELLAD